jgi:hypothetical protein
VPLFLDEVKKVVMTTTRPEEDEQLKSGETKEITFKCKICGKTKPLSQLRELRRFFPPIVACSDCDDKIICSGKRIKWS